jgi:hypothetical protein
LGLVGIRAIILLGLKGLISYWRDIGLACASIFFGIALSVTPVLFLNHSAYGRAIVSEFRAPEFRAAIGALMRVGDQHPSGYVPVSKASMNSIFANVPVAKSLSEHWPALSRGWSKHGAYLLDEDEEEIAGGWFVWAFRDAVAAAGHHHSAQSARQFYERLALEVNDACDSHTLNCRSPRDTLAPELKMDRISLFLKAIKNSLLYTATLSSPPIILPRSEGDTDQLLRWARLIGPVVVTSGVKVSGWIAHADSEPIITFGSDVHQKGREIEIFKKNEVVAALEKQGIQMSQAIRFRLLVDAQSLRHPISVKTDNDDKQHIKLNTIAPGKLPLKPPFMGYVDVVEHYEPISLSPYPLEEMRLAIVSTLTAGAHIVVPALCVTGMLGVLIYPFIWRRQQRSEWLFFLAVGAATAVVVRCGIIAYIHVTSWHAINVGYLGPSYPFVIIFAMAGSVILARALHIKHPVRKTFPKFSFFRD